MICDNENLIREILEMLPLSDWLKLEQLMDGYLETYTIDEFDRYVKRIAIEEFHQRKELMKAYYISWKYDDDADRAPQDILESINDRWIDGEITKYIKEVDILYRVYTTKDMNEKTAKTVDYYKELEKFNDRQLFTRKLKRTITSGNWKTMKQMQNQMLINCEIENFQE